MKMEEGPQAREPRQPLGAGRGQGTDLHAVPPEGRGLTASGLPRPETLFRPPTFRPVRKQICVKSVSLWYLITTVIAHQLRAHTAHAQHEWEKQDLLCRITDLQALETPKEKSKKGQTLN